MPEDVELRFIWKHDILPRQDASVIQGVVRTGDEERWRVVRQTKKMGSTGPENRNDNNSIGNTVTKTIFVS